MKGMQAAHLFYIISGYNHYRVYAMDGSGKQHKTSTLMKNLIKANNLDSFLSKSKEDFNVPPFMNIFNPSVIIVTFPLKR